MKNLTTLMLATSLMSLSQTAFSETAKHFEGKSLESIEEALEVFKEYNEQFGSQNYSSLGVSFSTGYISSQNRDGLNFVRLVRDVQ